MTKHELPPCPFCGTEPLFQHNEAHTHSQGLKDFGLPDATDTYVIECPTTNCCGMIGDSEAEVVDAWNRRQSAAVTPTLTDIQAINKAMQHMGDVLNGMDAVEDGDEESTAPGFEAIARLLKSVGHHAADGQDAPIGCVLAYDTKGHSKPCGQTMGANGAGEFVVIFHGTTEQADAAARKHIRSLERAGYRFNSCIIVHNEEAYHGPAITHVDAAIAAKEATNG